MRLDSPAYLAAHAYRLILEKDSQSIHYATIIETHHPSYLTQSELIDQFPMDADIPLAPDEVESLLRLVLDAD